MSDYVTIPENAEATLKFFPGEPDGIRVKQDTFKGNPAGYKTFYKVVDVNSENRKQRIFKANRKSSKLINDALGTSSDHILRIKHVGSGMETVYQPIAVQA